MIEQNNSVLHSQNIFQNFIYNFIQQLKTLTLRE
jgi:hypothetical protein